MKSYNLVGQVEDNLCNFICDTFFGGSKSELENIAHAYYF